MSTVDPNDPAKIFAPDFSRPFFQCQTKSCNPEHVVRVDPVEAPDPSVEYDYVTTRELPFGTTAYRWFRRSFLVGNVVEYWAQVRELPTDLEAEP